MILNTDTNLFEPIIDPASEGHCEDGTPALTCNNKIKDVFVTANGTIYFIDDNQIRTILNDGTVYTLYGGWSAEGDGGAAPSARLSGTNYIDQGESGDIYLIQNNSQIIRKVSMSDNLITRVAGNGNTGLPPTDGTTLS